MVSGDEQLNLSVTKSFLDSTVENVFERPFQQFTINQVKSLIENGDFEHVKHLKEKLNLYQPPVEPKTVKVVKDPFLDDQWPVINKIDIDLEPDEILDISVESDINVD